MKQSKKIIALILALILIISAGVVILNNIEQNPGGGGLQEEDVKGSEEQGQEPGLDSSQFQIHFIDVGQADAILVIDNGKTMLVDGGNAADSDLIYAYLTKLNIDYLDVVVCTHADEDHVGGIPGALTKCKAGKVYCNESNRNTRAFKSFVSKVTEQGLSIETLQNGDSFVLGLASVKTLSYYNIHEDVNNDSIVLRIDYKNTSFILSGDAGVEAEEEMLKNKQIEGATLLKVGHHGSKTSSSDEYIKAILPKYAIISVGKNNTYNLPNDSVLSTLKKYGVRTYRTDEMGDIIVYSNGEKLTFSMEKGSSSLDEDEDINTPLPDEPIKDTSFIGNKSSKVFHKTTCTSLPGESNRVTFGSREEAINAGYKACSRCNP